MLLKFCENIFSFKNCGKMTRREKGRGEEMRKRKVR
jgi:hypothetical protein